MPPNNNGTDDDNDVSNKRQSDTSDNGSGSRTKRSKTTNGTPPEDFKTLGDYFKDAWFKSGVTDEQKEDFLLELKIKTLKRNANFRQEAQKLLKIDLENFLNTGNESLIDLSFSTVKYPVNDLGIKKLPCYADLAFANLIIECQLGQLTKTNNSRRLHTYYKSKKWASALDMLCDKNSCSEGIYREYCIEIARSANFLYRSEKTKQLHRRNVLDMVVEPEENTSRLGEEQLVQLKAKLIAYFVRFEQQKPTGHNRWNCDHLPQNWNCCADARLLETLLDPKWQGLTQFAILPRGEASLVSGTDQSAATTVWNTVISVLFNNKERYKLKTRFPKDLDFWEFVPNRPNIRARSGQLLRDRLNELRSHFSKLFKKWKATADACFSTDLKQATAVFQIDGNHYEDCETGRTPEDVLNLTALYMFEIWSQNQDDEFINQVFGLADAGDEEDAPGATDAESTAAATS